MSKCVHDSLCPPLFAEDPEGDLQALEQWRDSDVDERAEHDDLQLLAQLRAGDLAASNPRLPRPASGRIRRGQHAVRAAMDFGGATA